mmetsp:Transcript_387/g.919  ORF Transcript_387/g.919 Transcript_387/m.919 type:complete len:234 (+) Transcript_387:1143-1844(+)
MDTLGGLARGDGGLHGGGGRLHRHGQTLRRHAHHPRRRRHRRAALGPRRVRVGALRRACGWRRRAGALRRRRAVGWRRSLPLRDDERQALDREHRRDAIHSRHGQRRAVRMRDQRHLLARRAAARRAQRGEPRLHLRHAEPAVDCRAAAALEHIHRRRVVRLRLRDEPLPREEVAELTQAVRHVRDVARLAVRELRAREREGLLEGEPRALQLAYRRLLLAGREERGEDIAHL